MTLYRLTQDVYQSNGCQADKVCLEDALADFFLPAATAEEWNIFLVLTCILSDSVNAWFINSSTSTPAFLN